MKALATLPFLAFLAGCGAAQISNTLPQNGTSTERLSGSNYRVIYSFKGGKDGAAPVASLLAVNGTLYGTTAEGGNGCSARGCGTVFSITPSGAETVLHQFGIRKSDGQYPHGSLTYFHGKLYGTTWFQGANGGGTIFAITTSGTETIVHNFGGEGDGSGPQANLVDVDNILYGTTEYGGSFSGCHEGCGTVFTLTRYGNESVLYTFKSRPDAEQPSAGLLNVKGTLYSTTEIGGTPKHGTVFTITPSGSETVLYTFRGDPDGAYPAEPVINLNHGMLYGVTQSGGSAKKGTVFALSTDGTESVIHTFGLKSDQGDGVSPSGALLAVNGILYGTTAQGGKSNRGTVFSITTSGQETILHDFAGQPGDGAGPEAGLIDVDGTLYGTTRGGGANGVGTVFSITP